MASDDAPVGRRGRPVSFGQIRFEDFDRVPPVACANIVASRPLSAFGAAGGRRRDCKANAGRDDRVDLSSASVNSYAFVPRTSAARVKKKSPRTSQARERGKNSKNRLIKIAERGGAVSVSRLHRNAVDCRMNGSGRTPNDNASTNALSADGKKHIE